MKTSFSLWACSGSRTLPSCIAWPWPLAHHSLPWKPLPAKRTARRTGGPDFLSCPKARRDSIHGSATVTEAPFRNARRVSIVLSLFLAGGLEGPVEAELAAFRHLQDRARQRAVLLQPVHHLVD